MLARKLPRHHWRGPNGFPVIEVDDQMTPRQYVEWCILELPVPYVLDLQHPRNQNGLGFTHPFLRPTFERLGKSLMEANARVSEERLWIPDTFCNEAYQFTYCNGSTQEEKTLGIERCVRGKLKNMHATTQHFWQNKWPLLYAWAHLATALRTATWGQSTAGRRDPAGNFTLTYFHIWQFNEVLTAWDKYRPVSQPQNKELETLYPHVLAGVGDWPRRIGEIAFTGDQIVKTIPVGMTPQQCGILPCTLVDYLKAA